MRDNIRKVKATDDWLAEIIEVLLFVTGYCRESGLYFLKREPDTSEEALVELELLDGYVRSGLMFGEIVRAAAIDRLRERVYLVTSDGGRWLRKEFLECLLAVSRRDMSAIERIPECLLETEDGGKEQITLDDAEALMAYCAE